jgi:hypothetical protein
MCNILLLTPFRVLPTPGSRANEKMKKKMT